MIRRLSLSLFCLLLLALLTAPAARACFIPRDPGQSFDTAYSDIAKAPVIVEALALRSLPDGYVEFQVTRRLRGAVPGHIRVSGQLFRDLAAYRGSSACILSVFQQDALSLLPLRPDGEGGYHLTMTPMHYSADGRAALHRAWVEIAAEIVRIEDTLPPERRIAAIRAALAASQGQGTAEEGERMKAERLSEHLNSVQALHPTAYLIWLHGELAAGRMPAGQRMTPQEFRQSLLWALSRPGRPDAATFFDGLAARTDDPVGLFFAMIHMAWHDRRGVAALLLSTHILTLPMADARTYLPMLSKAMSGNTDADADGEPAWRRDPALRDNWPDLAWGILKYLEPDDGANLFSDIAPYLRLPDPVAEPEKALWLVQNGDDPPVIAWAEQRLRDPANRAVLDDDRWQADTHLSLRIMAGTAQGEPLLTALFCRGGEARMAVIRAFHAKAARLRDGLYPRLLATPGLSVQERDGLLLVAATAVARNALYDHDYLAIIKGTPPKAEPLSCPARKDD